MARAEHCSTHVGLAPLVGTAFRRYLEENEQYVRHIVGCSKEAKVPQRTRTRALFADKGRLGRAEGRLRGG